MKDIDIARKLTVYCMLMYSNRKPHLGVIGEECKDRDTSNSLLAE